MRLPGAMYPDPRPVSRHRDGGRSRPESAVSDAQRWQKNGCGFPTAEDSSEPGAGTPRLPIPRFAGYGLRVLYAAGSVRSDVTPCKPRGARHRGYRDRLRANHAKAASPHHWKVAPPRRLQAKKFRASVVIPAPNVNRG